MIDHYDWPGGREAMLRFGPPTGPVVIAALPLFEEANRTRAFVVAILRALAVRGVAGVLPDLPGTGESLVRTKDATLLHMREAFAAVTAALDREGRASYALAIRSGALLDTLAMLSGRFRLSPMSGADVLREIARLRRLATGMGGRFDPYELIGSEEDPLEVAGNRVSTQLLTALYLAAPYEEAGVPLRTVRFAADPEPADLVLPGMPLWRRSEPGNDLPLAALLADDIAGWVATCAG